MQIVTIGGKVLFTGPDGLSLKETLESAVKAGANLCEADLRGAYLRGAYLGWANLRGASLRGADLGWANLCRADLGWANLRGASLRGANLRGAYLCRADLGGADLGGAKFSDSTVIDTGECWKEYLSLVVPALCLAGGKTMAEITPAWDCHSRSNCPMHIAFNVANLSDVPILFRPRADQFIRFFDAGLIPKPE